MRFGLTPEQVAFGDALDGLLRTADTSRAARRWGAGEVQDGLHLWGKLAQLGLNGLRVPESYGGLGASHLDLAVAFERLGYHAVPGPWIETVAIAPEFLAAVGDEATLAGIAEGSQRVGLSMSPLLPYAVDPQVSTKVYAVDGGTLYSAEPDAELVSVDPTRHLATLRLGSSIADLDASAVATMVNRGGLACAAQLLGAADRQLADAVAYAKSRSQFGRPIGEFQAIKHLLADVRIAVDFCRPLIHGAALSLDEPSAQTDRDVSAAKVAANRAAALSSRTALQVHGAIGYTEEYDLSLWLLRTRALVSAWGNSAWHRSRVLTALVGA